MLYETKTWLSVIPIITGLINSWVLLKYFSYTIQHILAHRIGKRDIKLRFIINIFLGIIINALLIYSLFVMIIAHTALLIGLV